MISVSYHNPLWVAERAVLLDHLTRGRFMLGLGPGSLPTDAAMIGLDQHQTRDLLAQGVDVIMHLLTSDEPLTFRNDRWDLRDARLHLRPVLKSRCSMCPWPRWPRRPVLRSPASTGSDCCPSAPPRRPDSMPWPCIGTLWKNAPPISEPPSTGATGGSSVSCTSPRPAIRPTVTSSTASSSGSSTSRPWPRSRKWPVGGGNVREMIDFVNDSGVGSIGTVDDARAQIDRLMKQSKGGFGCYMLLAHEWANPAATHRSYELISQHVFPEFQGQGWSTTRGPGPGPGLPPGDGGPAPAGRRGSDRQVPRRSGNHSLRLSPRRHRHQRRRLSAPRCRARP